jgi:hypothetical protein
MKNKTNNKIRYFVRRETGCLWRMKGDKLSFLYKQHNVWSGYSRISERLKKVKEEIFEEIQEQEMIFFL